MGARLMAIRGHRIAYSGAARRLVCAGRGRSKEWQSHQHHPLIIPIIESFFNLFSSLLFFSFHLLPSFDKAKETGNHSHSFSSQPPREAKSVTKCVINLPVVLCAKRQSHRLGRPAFSKPRDTNLADWPALHSETLICRRDPPASTIMSSAVSTRPDMMDE